MYTYNYFIDDQDVHHKIYDESVTKSRPYEKIFLGDDKEYLNNSILILLSSTKKDEKHEESDKSEKSEKYKYMFIGKWNVITFTTKDKITKYHSPMGNSGMCYPYGVSKKNTYLVVEDVYMHNDLARNDPYNIYYERSNVKGYKEEYPLKSKVIIDVMHRKPTTHKKKKQGKQGKKK